MNLKLTTEIHHGGKWLVGFCQELPDANGQGLTMEDCMQSLRDVVHLQTGVGRAAQGHGPPCRCSNWRETP